MTTRQDVEAVLDKLVGLIGDWNQLAYEPDERGPSNDAIAIILYDDGSGVVATYWGTIDKDPNLNLAEGHFKNTAEMTDYLEQWLDLDLEAHDEQQRRD